MSSSADQGSAPGQKQKGSRKLVAFVPLIAFAVLAVIFFGQLISGRDVSEVPSVLIGTKFPALDMPALEGLKRNGVQVPALNSARVEGQVTLVNIWASWCVPCRQEHPVLMELAKDSRINLVGINYKDESSNALRFLGELGNPYAAVGVDAKGIVAIDWGVYGIPETFLVDRSGEIIFKHIGPFSPDDVKDDLMPVIEKALSAPAETS